MKKFINDFRDLLHSVPPIIAAMFVISVVCMNLLANKSINTGVEWLALDCGILLSWITFLSLDIMTHCYGPWAATGMSIAAILINLLMSGIFFIAGHVPLHFTARTSSLHTTGDNLYSSLIFDVVNEAAKSLDIVYLFGHNHSKGWDCYIGGSSVYKAKSDTILIPVFSDEMINTDEYSKEKLEFTYLNAGYTGYYMNCGTAELDAGTVGEYHAADETLTGTVFEIFDDRIVITRYDADGVHALGHAGEADPYKGGIDEGLIPEEEYSRETAGPQQIPRESVYYEELKDAA